MTHGVEKNVPSPLALIKRSPRIDYIPFYIKNSYTSRTTYGFEKSRSDVRGGEFRPGSHSCSSGGLAAAAPLRSGRPNARGESTGGKEGEKIRRGIRGAHEGGNGGQQMTHPWMTGGGIGRAGGRMDRTTKGRTRKIDDVAAARRRRSSTAAAAADTHITTRPAAALSTRRPAEGYKPRSPCPRPRARPSAPSRPPESLNT